MTKLLTKTLPDWLAIIIVSKAATTLLLLGLGFG